MNTQSDLARQFSSRMGFALLVLAAHGLALGLAFGLVRLAAPDTVSHERPMTWVSLPVLPSPVLAPPMPRPPAPDLQLPAVAIPQVPAVILPLAEAPGSVAARPEAGTKRPLCDQPTRNGEAPCPALRASVPDTKLAPRQPTQTETKRAETKRTQELAHELAVQNAPLRLPCVAGPMVDPICLGMQVLHGFKVSSYVDMPDTPYSDPRKNTTKSQYWAKAPQDRWRHPPAPGVPSNQYLALAGGGKRK